MACSTLMPTSMSKVTDEKRLSSTVTPKPWRRSGSTTSATAEPGTPKHEDECSSTDAGDDITTVFVDFADLSSSDSEMTDDCGTSSPCAPTANLTTCVYSVMMLLRLRASVCAEDDLDGIRYGAKPRSELPAPATSKAKQSKAKQGLAEPQSPSDENSWRQALPASSAVSWVKQQRKSDPAEDEIVTRAARSILNKLTVEKFDSLFEQLTNCGINHPHHISILMREVFEKATIQHHFIPMYAQLCVQLEKNPRIASVVADADEVGQLQNFRRLLLNECQIVFEQVLESRSGEANVDEEVAFRRKQRALGNMKLIGQLLVHGMLSSKLFVECSEELLCKHVQCPEALEALVALVMVAGPEFDKSSWQSYGRLEKIFLDMNLLTKDKSVPPRLRFLIRDVLDARGAGWPQHSAARPELGPSKLEEVRSATETTKSQHNCAVASPACGKKGELCLINMYANAKKGEIAEPRETRHEELAKKAPWKAKQKSSSEADAADESVKMPTAATTNTLPEEGFQVVAFRREVNTIFNDLASDKNIPKAVQRVREQKVPVAIQASQFADILSRIVEERRGAVRRCELAFIAGLGAAENSAFDRSQCIAGVEIFFRDVYADLCCEVHRLPAIMKSEFMPTMQTVIPASDLNKAVPASMRK